MLYDTRRRKKIPQEIEQGAREEQSAGSGLARGGKVSDRCDEV